MESKKIVGIKCPRYERPKTIQIKNTAPLKILAGKFNLGYEVGRSYVGNFFLLFDFQILGFHVQLISACQLCRYCFLGKKCESLFFYPSFSRFFCRRHGDSLARQCGRKWFWKNEQKNVGKIGQH
jgi:hypothetical protein